MQTETFTLGPLTMYVSEDHRFGTDAFLLAYYANVKPDSVVCDLCTGCGIIPLIFCKNVKPHLIYAVDIQEEAIELLKMSVEKNHLENRLQPVLADLRELKQSQIGFESMDIVTANPPDMTSGSGFEKLARPQAVARHELMCNIDDVCRAAGKLLKYGGLLKMCHRPERLAAYNYGCFESCFVHIITPFRRLPLCGSSPGDDPARCALRRRSGTRRAYCPSLLNEFK